MSPCSLQISEQDSSRFEDIQKNWEILRLQHEREKETLQRNVDDLNSDKVRLKEKLQEQRHRNQELERFIMNYIEKTETERKQQASQALLLRRDEEILILKGEIRGLTQRLLEAESRPRDHVSDSPRKDVVEMEELLSCESSFVLITQATETYWDVSKTTCHSVIHTMPIDTDFMTQMSNFESKDPAFHLSNQMAQ